MHQSITTIVLDNLPAIPAPLTIAEVQRQAIAFAQKYANPHHD